MKKNIIIISVVIVLIVLATILFFVNKNSEKNAVYTVKVGLVDEKSPDRILTVYRNDKKINFKEIHYMDDVLLCEGTNPTIHFGDIKDEDELKIILENSKIVVAKIDKGDI